MPAMGSIAAEQSKSVKIARITNSTTGFSWCLLFAGLNRHPLCGPPLRLSRV
jgi:hypothetical protein